MSKILSKSALKALNRIGDIIAPQNGEFPSYSEYGCIEHIDDIITTAPQEDIKDLNLLLSVLAFMPGFVLKWLMNKTATSHDKGDGINVIFRQLDFGLKGIILSTYYSEKKGSNYTGKTPQEIIGFSINRVGLEE